MADKTRSVSIIIKAKNEADQVLGRVGLSLGKLAIAAGVATAAAGAAAFAIAKIAEAAAKQEDADVRLAVALASIGKNSQEAREHLSALATELERTSKQDDEAIGQMMATLIQLGRVGTDQIDRVARATVELAAVTRMDLSGAADLMSKAAQGQTQTLKRYGIVLDDTIPQNERFAGLLKLIETNMTGTAEALGKTLSGQLRGIGNDFENFIQALGTSIVQSETLRDVLGGVSGALQNAEGWVKENKSTIDSWVRSVLDGVLAVSGLGVGMFKFLATVAEIDLKIRSFGRGTFGSSTSWGEDMARLDKAIIELANTTGPAFSAALEEMRQRLDASAPPVKTLHDLIQTSHGSLDSLLITMHKQGETAVDVASKIKNFGTSMGTVKTSAQQLDEALKQLGTTTMAELDAQITGVDRALKLLEGSADESGGLPEQFRAVFESLLAMTEQLPLWTEDLSELFSVARTGAQDMLSLTDEIAIVIDSQMTSSALAFSDTMIDTAFGAKVAWGQFMKQLLADLLKAIARAAILRAISTIGTSGASAAAGVDPFLPGGGLARGGEVRGGIPGLDSVAAMLMPGEIVLPASLVKSFDAMTAFADRELSGPGTGARMAGQEVHFHLSVGVIDPGRLAGDLIDSLNEAVGRRGYRLISSEVSG